MRLPWCLQKQGNIKEAWMHYHLAKRLDPTIVLDAIYLEIITEKDLEKHTYFDMN